MMPRKNFIQAQIKGIVGLQIAIDDIEGKWKMSQNRPEPDRTGVVDGYQNDGATAMAALVRKHAG